MYGHPKQLDYKTSLPSTIGPNKRRHDTRERSIHNLSFYPSVNCTKEGRIENKDPLPAQQRLREIFKRRRGSSITHTALVDEVHILNSGNRISARRLDIALRN